MKKALFRIVSLVLLVVVTVSLCVPSCAEAPAEAEAQAKNGKRVYFAAPLFNEAEKAYNLQIVSILEEYGYEVFLPQRDGFLAAELEGLTEAEKTAKIFQKDRDETNDARSVEMDMDLNPMIAGCLDKIFYNLNSEKLIEELRAYLDTNEL